MKFNTALTVVTLLSLAGSCSAVKLKNSNTELKPGELETVARALLASRNKRGAFDFNKLLQYEFTENEKNRLTKMKKNRIDNEQLFQNILIELQAAKADEANSASTSEPVENEEKIDAGESNGADEGQKPAGDTDPANKSGVVDPPEDIGLAESKEGVKTVKDENADLSDKQADVSDPTSSPSDALALHTEIAPPKAQEREDVESNDLKKVDAEDTKGTTAKEVLGNMSEGKRRRRRGGAFRKAVSPATDTFAMLNETNLKAAYEKQGDFIISPISLPSRSGAESKDNSALSAQIEGQKIEAALADVVGNHGGQVANNVSLADHESKREIVVNHVDTNIHINEPFHNSAVDNVKESKQTDITEPPIQVEIHTSGIIDDNGNSNNGTALQLNDNLGQETTNPAIQISSDLISGASTITTSNPQQPQQDLQGDHDSFSFVDPSESKDNDDDVESIDPTPIEEHKNTDPEIKGKDTDSNVIESEDDENMNSGSTDPKRIIPKTDEPELVDPKKTTEPTEPEKKGNGTETTVKSGESTDPKPLKATGKKNKPENKGKLNGTTLNVDPKTLTGPEINGKRTETTKNVDPETLTNQKSHWERYKILYFGAIALSVTSIAAYFLINKFENDETDL